MPIYRIVSEPDPAAPHRAPRGISTYSDGIQRTVTTVEASSLAEAAADARDTEPHRELRITSIEEIGPGLSYTDEAITAALQADNGFGRPYLDPEDYEDETIPLYESLSFVSTIGEAAEALAESGLVPGLSTSVKTYESDGPYVMVEVFDEATHRYHSVGEEARHLTDDRSAVGWNGVLAIARTLIGIADELV